MIKRLQDTVPFEIAYKLHRAGLTSNGDYGYTSDGDYVYKMQHVWAFNAPTYAEAFDWFLSKRIDISVFTSSCHAYPGHSYSLYRAGTTICHAKVEKDWWTAANLAIEEAISTLHLKPCPVKL